MAKITPARLRFRLRAGSGPASRRGQRTLAVLASGAMLASGVVPAVAQEPSTESDLRIGVLAVADAIAAMGRTPELAEPLPFTRTSIADVLKLDDVVTTDLVAAMSGNDLGAALAEVDGIVQVDVESEPSDTVQRISFGYEQKVEDHALELAHDDGDLRFGANDGAGDLDVTLATSGEKFVVEVDTTQEEELLRFALVSEPELQLTVDIDGVVTSFTARQGFTDVDVTGGQYTIHRTSDITMRDPNGRGLLTLEDLRYSNLVDLYRVERVPTFDDPAEPIDEVDIRFDMALPTNVTITGAADAAAQTVARTGTLSLLAAPVSADIVWPDVADAGQVYGDALGDLTGLSMVEGVTALAEYTGTALVLQDAADVNFPNLGGSVADLFAPADDLLEMLATSAVAEIRCGLTPQNPPAGRAAPGDTVYCDAVTAQGLPDVATAKWTVVDGSTAIDDDTNAAAVGTRPSDTVRIDGSDGQPDVRLVLTFDDGTTMTARSLPRTVQDVTGRITEVAGFDGRSGSSGATVDLAAGRLAVDVDMKADTATAALPVGDPATLGALVGLTGLTAGAGGGTGTATAKATDASFDVGFGIPLGELAEGEVRTIDLLPADASLFTIGELAIPNVADLTGMTGRIGFLGVKVDVTTLSLGDDDGAPVVQLSTTDGLATPIALDDLLSDEGTLAQGTVRLDSQLTASIAFTAREQEMPGGGYATGVVDGASGGASVEWGTSGLPRAVFGPAYAPLRIFDPVPAAFLSGTAKVTGAVDAATVVVDVAVPSDNDLFAQLRVPEQDGVEVARRLVGDGVACQNVTLVDKDTLTCEGLAPDGTAAFANGDTVELIVLGDPFALRDGIIDGLAGSLNEFERLDGDNADHVDDDDNAIPDQYTSTLPLVDLTPAQLAVERGDLADGLAEIVARATADQSGATGGQSVSSAQELSAFATTRFGADSLAFVDEDTALGVKLTATSAGEILQAPLRFTDESADTSAGQVLSVAPVDVTVPTSSTTLATLVGVATARPLSSKGAVSTSTATLDATYAGLLQAGVAELTASAPSRVHLGVTVTTADDGSGLVTAKRTGSTATASLTVGDARTLTYEAEPWESSGGEGAAQPAPDPMKVRFLAEGLDGLAAALAVGLDGASPQVTGPDNPPVSAPLIGSDLDAGADVAGTLTELTRTLRTELGKPAVVDAATADELDVAVTAAVEAALAVEGDGISGTDVDVTVECPDCDDCSTSADEACEPVDGPTVWESVSVSAALVGEQRDGETPFSIGLAGVNVRSDQPVETTTSWTLPVTLELVRGVGPQATVNRGDALELAVHAEIPDGPSEAAQAITWAGDRCAGTTQCLPAIIGYLPGMLSTTSESAGSLDTIVNVALAEGAHDLFALYDGVPATPTFSEPTGPAETGLALDFETVASEYGSFDLVGTINVPWTASGGFGNVTYDEVKLDVGEVIAMLATPFDVVDPYLAPARDVIDVLRTPIPVVSDISTLAGGGSISLLSIVEEFGGTDKRLDLVIRITGFLETAVDVVEAVAAYANQDVPLEKLRDSGAVLTLEPTQVEFASSCTQTIRTTTSAPGTGTGGTGGSSAAAPRTKKATQPCPPPGTQGGARNQTTNEQRRGNRQVKTSVATTTKTITGAAPGFSVPFLADPDQILDVLTGEGEATYFRLDLGTLEAQVAYTRKFGPIMAGPVPIVPFIGGSIGISGRMAVGFDSMPQTLAVQTVADGDIVALVGVLDGFDGGDIIREGFYLDDLDADGVDVAEVKLVTTLEAGAGVSIGIVTAGLKGGLTLTINLDMNDPNDDGRIRIAEIRTALNNDLACLFDVSATLEAFIQIFVEIELLVTRKNFVFDILRLGPYTLFEYGCETVEPTLVVGDDTDGDGVDDALLLTSGPNAGSRGVHTNGIAEDYEVRQFDAPDRTTFEISALNRVQRVTVVPTSGGGATVRIFQSGVTWSTTEQARFTVSDASQVRFRAEGWSAGAHDDQFAFLLGETFEGTELVSTPFTTPVALYGHGGDDILTTGDANDVVDGGAGNDSISVGLGDDRVTAGTGNDIVGGGAGQDDIDGGGGNDRLEGGPGPDRLAGGEGDDALVGGPGRDVRALLISGGDHPTPQQQADLGFDSGDVLVGDGGDDMVDGGDGSDVVVGGDAATLTGADMSVLFAPVKDGRTVSVLSAGGSIDEAYTVDIRTAVPPTWAQLDALCVSGTPLGAAAGGDIVTGGPESDVVVGGNGPDQLDGGGDDDAVCGRAGDDDISGDGGAPASDAGDDVIRGGHGNDLIEAGPGDDVAYGDDAVLVRGPADVPVRDGTLGSTTNAGSGDDYVDAGDGDDVVAGGAGSDLLRGGTGEDQVHGEAADTPEAGGSAPALADRLVACNPTTRIVEGLVDLNGDLLAGSIDTGVVVDDGRMAGLEVAAGVVQGLGTGATFTGLIAGETVVLDGKVDLDRDGTIDTDDTGTVPLASMLATTATNTDGDCILGEDGDDDLSGGTGSDHVAAGAGTDLVDGGDGNDLLIGDGGTDVILGGPHHDVLVGSDGDDHLVGAEGDDRLRGNGGDDDLIGGTGTGGATDGQDVLLGGRGQDLLAGENAVLVSDAIVSQVGTAPWTARGVVPAAVTATTGSRLRFSDSAATCGSGPATRWAQLLPGAAGETRAPVASPGLEPFYDELYGGFGCDWVFGQEGDDLVRGGQDDDVVEAGPGEDTGYGDAGDDVVIGGSSVDQAAAGQITVARSGADVADGADTLYGDGGPDDKVGDDIIIGDNGTPVFEGVGVVTSLLSLFGVASPAPVRIVLADVPAPGAQPTDPEVFGDDVVHAGGGDDVVFGQSGDDTLHGDAGDDHVEGNLGVDTIRGGEGDDDLIGGSSATDGQPMGDDGRRLVEDLGRYDEDGPGKLVDETAAGLVDGDDTIQGGDGEDVVLGDNGRITRPGGLLVSGSSTQATRHVAMADTTPGVASGSDTLSGDAGNDVLYGQLDNGAVEGDLGAGDQLDGGDGNDTLIGDVAVVVPTVAGEVGDEATLTLRREIISELVYADGTLVPVTHVPDNMALVGGSDVARGGDGDDVLRLGAGDDLANGGDGDDALFGAAGNDALWGGPDQDRLFGGYGADDLDLKARDGDPDIYADVAGVEDTDGLVSTVNHDDLIYGGWGSDELQADVGAAGPQPVSDHLVDWVGAHNVYYVCEGAYGAGRVIRQQSPAMVSLLEELVRASGGTQTDVEGSGGWYDFGLVGKGDNSANSRKSPEAPGNHTCEDEG